VSEYYSNDAWFYYGDYGGVNRSNKHYAYSVRPLLALEV
jgi:hypothetical protein